MSAVRKELARAAWGLICFKTGYFMALAAVLLLWGDLGEFIRLPQRWTPKAGPGFASHFTGWDAGYYLSLSEQGYRAGDSACAFNPLWPSLVRWFAPLAGGSHLIAGLVLANILSAAGFLVFVSVAGSRFGAPAAKLALLFLLAFPGSLFFQFVYSESVFFFLVMLLWWGLERRRYGVAAAAAFLLPLARSVGLFALLPLAWHVLEPAVKWLIPILARIVNWRGGGKRGASCLRAGRMPAPLYGRLKTGIGTGPASLRGPRPPAARGEPARRERGRPFLWRPWQGGPGFWPRHWRAGAPTWR